MKKMNTIKAVLLVACIAMSQAAAAQFAKVEKQLQKILYAESAIMQMYVDTVNAEKLTEDAIRGMLKELDPHSTYTPAKDVESLNEQLNGSFDGIGVQFNMDDDTLVVIQPVSNGPSEKVGIIAGDRIVTVNDTAIAGVKMSKENIMRMLRGPKGTKVRLGVVRRGIKDKLAFNVTRDKIPVYTIDASYMIDPTTGYVRISSFGATTNREFIKAATSLLSQGMKDIVIDLQGNGGGYLQAAVDLADEFLSDNEMIVYTDGRTTGRHEYHAKAGKIHVGKIVVLVDGYTASAAEILSGALQDNDRAVIVGRRTFAKGLVQRPVDLPDGSLIRLTVAHYYSPVGRCFQKPYVKGDKKKYDMDMLDRLNSGELMSADSIRFPDSLKYTTVGGRTVYGGGGIMPDVYVPLDTTRYTSLHRELVAKGCVTSAVLKWLNNHRAKMEKTYKVDDYRKARARMTENKPFNPEDMRSGFQAFVDHFTVQQDIMDVLLKKATEAKIEYNDSTLQAAKPMLTTQIKALIARDLWDMSEYFEIINETSEIYLEGLKALKDETAFKGIRNN